MQQHVFTIEQLEALVKSCPADDRAGQQARTQTRHVPYAPPPKKRDIRREIFNVCWDTERAVTLREICAALGVRKSTWLRAHVQALVDDGYLIQSEQPYRPNLPCYVYEVAR